MHRLALYEQATGHSLYDSEIQSSPLIRPRSVQMALQPRDCIISVKSASELARQLKEHAGKVSCVITAFGTCQKLQQELGLAMYEGANKDKVSVRLAIVACSLERVGN